MRLLFTLISCLVAIAAIQAQNNYWTDVEEQRILLPAQSETMINAARYRTLALDLEGLKSALRQAPMEFTPAAAAPVRISLPLPEGGMETFDVVESPVMAPELAARFPGIRSFQAYSVKNPLVSARFDYSVNGFTAAIQGPEGKVFIEPYATNQTAYYYCYNTRDLRLEDIPALSCGFDDFLQEELNHEEQLLATQSAVAFRNNAEVPLRTYRLALACTGEYAQQKGGTLEAVVGSMNTAVNLVNQIFQLENAVRMQLIANNNIITFLDPMNDPYSNANSGGALLGQNPSVLNSLIGPGFYDIGHVFTSGCTDVGGVAMSSTICAPNKASGVTCHYTNNITYIATQVMAHEIGHQFSCGHSWSNCPGIEDQLSPSNAFEPGSGSTIMSYQGSCGPDNNITGPPGNYYNIGSLEDFIFFARVAGGSECGETSTIGNNMPEVMLPYTDGFHIPVRTPFELTAQATDPDGDTLTYCWEQYDLGPSGNLGSPTLDAPIFRSYAPTTNPTRVFPRLNKIVNLNYDNEEVFPTYGRNLTFRCTVRDNNPDAGGTVWEEVKFKVDGTAGPFKVRLPDTSTVVWKVGSYEEVKWDVANTDNNRVKCFYVNIKLSVDGGYTYPYTLLEGTPNDGSAFVTVPDAVTEDARIRVEAVGNIFFDISNKDFQIAPADEPGYVLDVSPAALPLYCLPGDPLSVDISTASILGYDSTISLSLLGELPATAAYSFGQQQLSPGESTTLTIDLGNFVGRDTLELLVQAIAPGQDTAYRELYISALSSDFSQMALLEPADGADGIIFSTNFSWTEAAGADTYDFELATSPAFGNTVVEQAAGLTGAAYTPQAFLAPNDIYFWRVRPVNECGPADWLPPFALRTATVDCAANAPTDLPINLSNNPSTKTSRIFVPTSGLISDLNLTDLEVTFQPVNSLRISLRSPAGTEVRLFDQDCLNTSLIRTGFDDEAPSEIVCPPDDNLPMRPSQPLSAFDGEDSFGEWQLKVQVMNSGFGGGGTIKSWKLEFCAALTPTPPVLIRNETLAVPPGQGNPITKNLLEVQHPQANTEQLIYTLVTAPAHGQLYRLSLNEPLEPGSRFSQATINTLNLMYVHDGSATTEDHFRFIVEDNEGGWIPQQVFNIEIGPGAVVSAPEAAAGNDVSLFPNPADEEVAIRFRNPASGNIDVRVLSLQGQMLQQRRFAGGGELIRLSTDNLPAGIYFVQVQTEQGSFVKRLIVH